MPSLPKIPILAFVAVAAFLCGCQTTTTLPDATPNAAESLAEASDPTAIHLHDLAGALLEYRALKQALPEKLEDLAPLAGKVPHPAAVDPATGKTFVYLPDGPKFKSLPGRILVYQSTVTGHGGPWCLLMNDQNSEGRIVTYVQRIPDEILKELP